MGWVGMGWDLCRLREEKPGVSPMSVISRRSQAWLVAESHQKGMMCPTIQKCPHSLIQPEIPLSKKSYYSLRGILIDAWETISAPHHSNLCPFKRASRLQQRDRLFPFGPPERVQSVLVREPRAQWCPGGLASFPTMVQTILSTGPQIKELPS